jgi:hypothetical protein
LSECYKHHLDDSTDYMFHPNISQLNEFQCIKSINGDKGLAGKVTENGLLQGYFCTLATYDSCSIVSSIHKGRAKTGLEYHVKGSKINQYLAKG